MRAPTPPEIALAWHSARLAGAELETVHEEPHAGWFKRRLVKKGCWVPARIWLEQETDEAGELIAPERMLCEVDGQRRDPADQWLWLCQEPISEREFNYLTRLRAWQRINAPEEWDPMVPVDHTKTPIVED